MDKLRIYIDDQEFLVDPDQNLLQLATDNGVDIPHFCHHEDLPTGASCRICLVEVDGQVTTSCTLIPKDGLKIYTNTPSVERLRKQNLELLFADHRENCPYCKAGYYCKIVALMDRYGVSGTKYIKPKIEGEETHKLVCAAELDPQLCIACNKCVEICQKIGIGFLQIKGKANQIHATWNRDPDIDCVYCGQCTVHCPVYAAREQNEIAEVEAALNDKSKIVIAQMAPSVRASIGEEFGLEPGIDLTGRCFSAFREMGFDRVFDVNMGADITTIVEAKELVERIANNRDLPMFTSCCPAWVKYVEFYRPDLIKHLTTSRSPQIHSGGAYKTWWAEREGIDPKDIVVVSFMPCTSKKYEAKHEKMKINGMYPVDHVLTVREFATLLRKRDIDLIGLESSEVDEAGAYSGAAAIYGASGGVMESALRTAYETITGEELERVEFKQVRGMKGIKRATIEIGDMQLKVVIAATAKNARKVLAELERDPDAFHYMEVMACPGGCIGGGGQPIPTTDRIVKQRIECLYQIDDEMKLRKAHENPVVREFFDDYIAKISHQEQAAILHTSYSKKNKFE